MFFRQRTAANATLSYLFGCAGHQMAIAVDVVAGDEDWFIAEAAKVKADLGFVSGEELQATTEKLYATPPAVIERLRTSLGTGGK